MPIKEKLADYLSLYALSEYQVNQVKKEQQALARKLADCHNQQNGIREEIALLVLAADLVEKDLLVRGANDHGYFAVLVESEDELYGRTLDLGANGYYNVTITELHPFLSHGEEE